MKKISGAILILFLMACGSNTNQTTFAPEPAPAVATAGQGQKFLLKAANSMYVVIAPDSGLVASQPDPTKAEVFEKIDLGNGKSALKASNGKFVSDNRNKNSKVDAFRDKAQGWEEFEIIALNPTAVNIKTSAGKYVCADLGGGNVLIANRDKAGQWETFFIENK